MAKTQAKDASGNPVDPALLQDDPAPNTEPGSNEPPRDQMLKSVIVDDYDPKAASIDEAAEFARQEIGKFRTAEAAVKTTRTAALSMALADFAFYLVEEDKIICDANAWSKLRDEVRAISGDASVSTVVAFTRDGADRKPAEHEVLRATVFDGIAPQYIKGICQRAMLYAIGAKSAVQIGFLRRTQKAARFDKMTEWKTWQEVPEDERDHYYQAPCIPWNRIRPHEYEVKTNNFGKYLLAPAEGNTDETLHYLADDWCDALYLHHFAGAALVFDTEQKTARFPTGLLIGSKSSRQARTRATQAKGTGEFALDLQRLAKGGETLAAKLHACAAVIVAQPPQLWGCPVNEVRQGAYICARAALHGQDLNQNPPKGQEAAELIELFQHLSRRLSIHADGTVFWRDPEGDEIEEMRPSNTPLDLTSLGELTAELRKADKPAEPQSEAAAE